MGYFQYTNARSKRMQAHTNVRRWNYTGPMLEYEISAAEAATLLKEGKTRLIDVREPWEFETAKIEGSVLIPMGDVPARAHQELDPDEHLVVMCHHGMRSMNVTVWLRNQGFEQAQSLRGGIDAWSAEVDPAVQRY
jgi:rhodanese-related sulfurtransferase